MPYEDTIVTYDFATTFPYFTWVSSWSRDSEYPNGFRYKIFATHDGKGHAEMVLVLEHGDGLKKEMKRFGGDEKAVLQAIRTFVEGLSSEYGLEFDEFDLSSVASFEEFEAKAAEFGWPEQ